MTHVGYGGLVVAGGIIASVTSDNLLVVGALLGILVAISTLMIRLSSVIEASARGVVHKMQADGDLPTILERSETQRTLEQINETLRRIDDH